MKKYNEFKNDCGCSFFNYPNNELSFESIKNGKNIYVLPRHQVANNSHINVEDVEVLPLNTYSNQPFVNGDKIDFTLPNIPGYLYYKFFLSFAIKNNNAGSLTYINPCFWLEKCSILKNGNEISSVDNYFTWLKNMDHLNPLTLDLGTDLLDTDATNILNTNSTATTVSKTYLIDVPISLRKTLLPCIFGKDLTLRIKFKKNITTNAVPDTDVIMSNLKLICKFVDVPSYIYKGITNYPHINSILNKPLLYTRILSGGVVNGTENYIDFDVKNNISQLYVFLTDTNATNANLQTFYSITNTYINSPSGLNIINGRKLTPDDNTQTLYEIFNKDNKFYFYRKLAGTNGDKFWIFDFTNHTDSADANHYAGSESFKSGVFRIYFTPLQTVATSITVNVLCFIPSLLTLKKDGEYTETYN